MKIAVTLALFGLLFGGIGSHASKSFDKADAMSAVNKMLSLAKSNSLPGPADTIREAALYLKRKEALPRKLNDRLSRRAIDDGDDAQPACMDSCDMDIQSLDNMTDFDKSDFCSSHCWKSCLSW